MSALIQSGNSKFYCPDCDMHFGSIFDANGEIRCPLCKKVVDRKLNGVTHIDGTTYRCDRCALIFGSVLQSGNQIKCPICPN